MKQNLKDLPLVNKRIQELINENFNGNVRKFSSSMGLSDSSKINRLFNKDKRNGEYPTPSSDIILLISETFNISTDWLLKGKEDENRHVNNITIDRKEIKGNNNNVVGDDNKNVLNSGNSKELIDIIKQQQEQISVLINLFTNGNGQSR